MSCQFIKRMPEIQRNLHKLYRQATDADLVAGRDWYPNAHRIVLQWADTYSYPIATVACVVSAISPQCEWERNLIIADDILAGRPPSIGGAIRKFVERAKLIRDHRATQITPYFPHGPKVASFACNLAGDYSVVTVDTHAMQAGVNDVQANYRLRWSPYSVFAECYRRVAIKVSCEPATFQAILWHTWKRLHPRVSKLQERRQWHVIGMED
jgi:hypothetical protein